MPIYEYECRHCGRRFDKMQPMTAEPVKECVHCGQGPVRRIFHPVGVVFKGSGWYITDSRKPDRSSSDFGSSSSSESKPSSTTKPTESSGEARAATD